MPPLPEGFNAFATVLNKKQIGKLVEMLRTTAELAEMTKTPEDAWKIPFFRELARRIENDSLLSYGDFCMKLKLLRGEGELKWKVPQFDELMFVVPFFGATVFDLDEQGQSL